jgi:thermostable 8-oxoguanine DNA glycosylase
LDNLIKKSFSTLTKNEYIQIKEKLEEKAPFWKLYMTELMVFIFAIWTIELGGGVG